MKRRRYHRRSLRVKWEYIWLLILPFILLLVYLLNGAKDSNLTRAVTTSREHRLTSQPYMKAYGDNSHSGYNSTGEALAANVSRKCQTQTGLQNFEMKITTNNKYRILFCPICKVASTFWTRFFVMLNSRDTTVRTPYDIPIQDAPPSEEKLRSRHGHISYFLTSKYKFFFVRNPYSRILSAYVDKLFAPNPVFWNGVSKPLIIRQRHLHPKTAICGHDLTFLEYVTGIVGLHSRSQKLDCHDASYHSYCHVCEIKYDFIGKLESFVNDAFFLFQRLGLNETLSSLATSFSWHSGEDALYDTVSSAFKMRKDIEKCISFDEALRRVWRKLQIRGVIGKEERFPLSVQQSQSITQDEFLRLARTVREKTPPSLRRHQRHEAMIEIYRTLPLSLLEKVRDIYAKDLSLFEYDPMPDFLFKRDSEIDHFGYLDV